VLRSRVVSLAAILLGLLLCAQPADAAIALVGKAAAQATSTCTGGGDAVTSGIDTTAGAGASLYVVVTTENDAQTTPTESTGTVTFSTVTSISNVIFSRVFYGICTSGSCRSASHTFTASNANRCAGIAVLAFSGTDTSAPLDQSTSASTASGLSQASGSITPTTDNQVVVTLYAGNSQSVNNPPTSFTAGDTANFNPGVAYAVASAYEIQTTATARNPSWTWNDGSHVGHAHVASFKSGGAAPPATPHGCGQLLFLGVGCEAQP
jgi:hypothetical protein